MNLRFVGIYEKFGDRQGSEVLSLDEDVCFGLDNGIDATTLRQEENHDLSGGFIWGEDEARR